MRWIGQAWFIAPTGTVLLLVLSGAALAVTPEELTGDYTLVALQIDYGSTFPPAVDENDFPSLSGYFSATGVALVYEHAGMDRVNNNTYGHFTAGQYQLSGNIATITRADGTAVGVQIAMPDSDTVEVPGVGVTVNIPLQTYNYTYRYARDATYYTQAALDAAVTEATEGLLSPETCDQMIDDAVDEALDNVEPVRVPIVIPIGD